MVIRTCTACNEIKLRDDFYLNWVKRDQKYRIGHECRCCTNTRNKKNPHPKEYYVLARHKRKMRSLLYLGNKCLGCGFCVDDENYYAFDFHHIDPTQRSVAVGSGLNLLVSWENLTKELNKCVLLCSNCHRIFHGMTKSGYGYTRELRKEQR